MNMTGFRNTDYRAGTNRTHWGGGPQKSSTGPAEGNGQSLFAEQMEARTKKQGSQGTAAKDEVSRYKQELERTLLSQNTRRFRVKNEDEHVLFQPKKEGSGVFSKKTLAELAGYELSDDFSLESDGTGTLTEDQIQYLRKKYDMEELSETDYHDLLAELAEMNVLSREDVKRQFVRKIPPCTTMVMPWHRDMDRTNGGNYLEKLQKELNETEYILSMINAGKCSVSPAGSLEAVREFYKEEQEYRRKMADLFRQLQECAPKTSSGSGTENSGQSVQDAYTGIQA